MLSNLNNGWVASSLLSAAQLANCKQLAFIPLRTTKYYTRDVEQPHTHDFHLEHNLEYIPWAGLVIMSDV